MILQMSFNGELTPEPKTVANGQSFWDFGTETEEVLALAETMMEEHLGQQALGRLLRALVEERDALRVTLSRSNN